MEDFRRSQMNKGFRIDRRQSTGNLHISLYGEFNGMCAWELFKTIKRYQAASRRIFVNTAWLDIINQNGADLFKTHMKAESIKKERVYFKGEKGLQIAPDGSRVLIIKQEKGQKRSYRKKSANSLCRLKPMAESLDLSKDTNQ
jgi:hypothetical protein